MMPHIKYIWKMLIKFKNIKIIKNAIESELAPFVRHIKQNHLLDF